MSSSQNYFIHVTHARLTRYPSRVDREEVMRVLRAFESAGLEYVLIGAAAMGFHGLVRATEDLDLFIRATPANIEKLENARVALGAHIKETHTLTRFHRPTCSANIQPCVTFLRPAIYISMC